MWFFGLPLALVIVIPLFVLLLLAFEIWMIVDCIKNPKLSDSEKALWVIGMLLIHPFVALIYFLIGRDRD
jgi:hypothetical protein